jgi:hypothetical protein
MIATVILATRRALRNTPAGIPGAQVAIELLRVCDKMNLPRFGGQYPYESPMFP